MSTISRRRESAVNMITLPPDYPHHRRAQSAEFLKQALGGISNSTFFKYRAMGRIPAPDIKTGRVGRWFETTIAATVASFANGEIEAPQLAAIINQYFLGLPIPEHMALYGDRVSLADWFAWLETIDDDFLFENQAERLGFPIGGQPPLVSEAAMVLRARITASQSRQRYRDAGLRK